MSRNGGGGARRGLDKSLRQADKSAVRVETVSSGGHKQMCHLYSDFIKHGDIDCCQVPWVVIRIHRQAIFVGLNVFSSLFAHKKKIAAGMVVHTYNPHPWEIEGRGL